MMTDLISNYLTFSLFVVALIVVLGGVIYLLLRPLGSLVFQNIHSCFRTERKQCFVA